MKKACKNCRAVVEGDKCLLCGNAELTKTFEGMILILNPEGSEIAAEIGAKVPGKYVLKLK